MTVKLVGHKKDAAAAEEAPPKALKKAKDGVPLSAVEALRVDTRFAYRDLQKCWFTFAKKISEIKTTGAFTAYAFESFKDFCAEEYPEIPFSTVSKYIKVVESWGGALEARMLKAPDEPLPSYDACYEVAIAEDKMPKEEIPKLRKSVLERKVTRAEVRDQLASFRRPKIVPEKTIKKLDKELKAAEVQAKVDAKAETENLDVVQDMRSDTGAEQLLTRVKMVFENLEPLTKGVKEVTPKVLALAEYLRDNEEKFKADLDAFLERVAELSNDEE